MEKTVDRDDTILCKETLQYFGTMLPLVSHEAKNILAVIKENAGLMDDYLMMAQNGKPLNVERLSSLPAAITKQVGRLNALITDVRQTAAEIDTDTQSICLIQHARQVSELLSKKAATRSIQLQVCAQEETIPIRTRPVLLRHMIWRCLDYAIRVSQKGQPIELTLEKRAQNGVVLISGIDGLEPGSDTGIMPDEQRQTVLAALNSELTINDNERTMMLKIRNHHV
jgi:signal transduction histidine kinase